MTCWQILQIEPTDDRRTIKRAYSALLKATRPDENPDAFQQLNDAYQQALSGHYFYVEDNVDDVDIDIEQSVAETDIENSETVEANVNPDETFHRQEADADKQSARRQDSAQQRENLTNNIEHTQAQTESEKVLSETSPEQLQRTKEFAAYIDSVHYDVDQYIEALDYHLASPSSRQDPDNWAPFISSEVFRSFEFKHHASLRVFAKFVEYYTSNKVAAQGGFIPSGIVTQVAELFSWKDYELEISQTFHHEDVEMVFAQAFGDAGTNQPPQDMHANERRKKLTNNLIVVGIWFVVLSILYQGVDYVLSEKQRKQAEQIVASTPGSDNWTEELDVCNQINQAEPGESLNRCQALAEQGWPQAQKRLAWLYTRDNEYRNWQEAFNWLKEAASDDTTSKLIGNIMLFQLGESEQEKINGEEGIRALANIGLAPAQAYLATLHYLDEARLPKKVRPMWLLESAFEKDQRYVSAFEVATAYANGFGTQANIEKATELLMAHAKSDFPLSTNNVAWFLATLDTNPFSNADYPLTLIESVINDPRYAQSFAYVDTQAAAYAAKGDMDTAIYIQKKAIDLFDSSDVSARVKEQQRPTFVERLERYQRGEKEIESQFNIDPDVFFENIQSDIEVTLLNYLRVATIAQ